MSINIRKLEAPEGYVYIYGETSGKIVYLGKNDVEDNWTLVKESDVFESMSETEEKALAYDILMGVIE